MDGHRNRIDLQVRIPVTIPFSDLDLRRSRAGLPVFNRAVICEIAAFNGFTDGEIESWPSPVVPELIRLWLRALVEAGLPTFDANDDHEELVDELCRAESSEFSGPDISLTCRLALHDRTLH